MNIEGVYTPPKFITRGIDPSTRGTGAHNEYQTGVHPSDIHRQWYRALDMGCRGTL